MGVSNLDWAKGGYRQILVSKCGEHLDLRKVLQVAITLGGSIMLQMIIAQVYVKDQLQKVKEVIGLLVLLQMLVWRHLRVMLMRNDRVKEE